ncbi:hypothetical protein [Streptomyces cinerochromogenes]|uniref:hypothetical protein n=1 Tax=Streptomyces cinerochromogenes TaxID=66422 RepID=UPI0016716C5F|nr:hypothetical protein [Streptomyces cinerochromogenes]
MIYYSSCIESLLFALLDHPASWRTRAVEQIELHSARWSIRERTVETRPLIEVAIDPKTDEDLRRALRLILSFEPHTPELLLPVANLSRDPSFDLKLQIGKQSVSRISRERNSLLQARYIIHLAQRAGFTYGVDIDKDVETLLTSMFQFISSPWRAVRRSDRIFGKLSDIPTERLYIENIINWVPDDDFKAWQDRASGIGKIITKHRWAVPYPDSPTQNPLLAVPRFVNEVSGDRGRVLPALNKLLNLLKTANDRVHDPASTSQVVDTNTALLSTYATYGRRREVIVIHRVPLRDPLTMEVSEKRVIYFSSPMKDWARWPRWVRDRFFPRARHHVAFADARTNHLRIRVPDSSVRIVKWGSCARDDAWKRLPTQPRFGRRPPDDQHKDHEYYSRYGSTPRPARLWVEIQLCQALPHLFVSWGLILITWSAIALLVIFGWANYTAQLTSGDAVVILLPVTFAASSLLVRETTSLGMFIRRGKHFLLLLSLLSLWALAFTLYCLERIKIG